MTNNQDQVHTNRLNGKDRPVLIVDDRYDNLTAARNVLIQRGYTNIFEATCLKEALTYLEYGATRLSNPYPSQPMSLVITDLNFPEEGDENRSSGKWDQKLRDDLENKVRSQESLLSEIKAMHIENYRKDEYIKDPEEAAQNRIDYLIQDCSLGRESAFGIQVIEECQRRAIPYSVVTGISGHGSLGLSLLATNGILPKSEFLRAYMIKEDLVFAKDIAEELRGSVSNTPIIFSDTMKTEGDYNLAIDKAEEMQRKLQGEESK